MDLSKPTQASSLLTAFLAENAVTPPPLPTPPATTIIRAGQNHIWALENALAGDVLAFEPGVYEGAITLRRGVTLQPTVPVPMGRRTAAFSPVTLISSSDVSTITHQNQNGGVHLVGLTIKNANSEHTLVDDVGVGLLLDRMALLGDPVKGQRRGLAANGENAQVSQTLIDDCFRFGADSQAIMGWNGTKGLIVDDCALFGGAETVMFGGATAINSGMNPRDILIRRSLLSKKVAWYAMGVQVKNALELKNAVDVKVLDNILEYGGINEGQGAYVIVLTPRNQDGDTPWATVQRVLIDRNVARHGAGGVSFLGTDSNNLSGILRDVTVRNTLFDDIKPTGPWGTGAGRVFTFENNPQKVTLDSLTVRGANLGAAGYFMPWNSPPMELVLRNIVMPPTRWGWKIDAGGSGLAAVKAYAPDAVIDLKATDTGAVGYPQG